MSIDETVAPQPGAGRRIHHLRRSLGLTQAEMARRLGLSASYLNLIEHDRRPLTLKLLVRFGETFGIDLPSLSAGEESRLLAELREAFADPVFGADAPGADDLHRLATRSGSVARALLRVYRAYRQVADNAHALGDALRLSEMAASLNHEIRTQLTSIRSFSEILRDNPDLDPDQRSRFSDIIARETERLVSLMESIAGPDAAAAGIGGSAGRARDDFGDFLQDRLRYFPELEAAAVELRARTDGASLEGGLVARLAENNGIVVEVAEEGAGAGARRFNLAGRNLW